MVIETFFSDFGKHLLVYLSNFDRNLKKIQNYLPKPPSIDKEAKIKICCVNGDYIRESGAKLGDEWTAKDPAKAYTMIGVIYHDSTEASEEDLTMTALPTNMAADFDADVDTFKKNIYEAVKNTI